MKMILDIDIKSSPADKNYYSHKIFLMGSCFAWLLWRSPDGVLVPLILTEFLFDPTSDGVSMLCSLMLSRKR